MTLSTRIRLLLCRYPCHSRRGGQRFARRPAAGRPTIGPQARAADLTIQVDAAWITVGTLPTGPALLRSRETTAAVAGRASNSWVRQFGARKTKKSAGGAGAFRRAHGVRDGTAAPHMFRSSRSVKLHAGARPAVSARMERRTPASTEHGVRLQIPSPVGGGGNPGYGSVAHHSRRLRAATSRSTGSRSTNAGVDFSMSGGWGSGASDADSGRSYPPVAC